MTCAELERWLDDGGPESGAAAAAEHAAECDRCAEALRVDLALEAALSAAPTPAPAGFTDHVMARIGTVAAPAAWTTPALPWWIRVSMEPVTILALVVAGGIAWGWQGLWALAGAGGAAFARAAQWLPLGIDFGASGALALQIAMASLLALSAGALYRASGRLARRIPMTRP